ncbi:MAG: pyruvate carboxylase subunit B [Bacillota bacterium]
MKRLEFVEETFRDAQQSLWATRMRTESMLGIAPVMDDAGFKSVCIMSGAAFEAAVMYLYEDPWERIHLLRKLMPKTELSFLIRGRNVIGWRRFPNDVVELVIKCIKKAGLQWIALFDGLNDLRNLEWHIHTAKNLGLKVSTALVFSESPVHTDEYFAEKARELVRLGVDAVSMADASGVLTPERTNTLIPALRQVVGEIELQFVSHCTTGLANENYIVAMQNGVDSVSTVSLPLAYGTSDPATIDIIPHARQMGLDVRVDERLVREIDDYFYWVAYKEKKPVGCPVKFNSIEYKKYAAHQIPGGMMSNLVSQLTDLGLRHKLEEVLEESARVRQEIGYPVMVTPFSQLVGVQATLNVIEGKRYYTIPQELRLYARGYYGRPAAPIDPNILDLLVGDEKPIDPEEGFLEPLVSKVRADQGPFASDEELVLALVNTRQTLEKFYKNKKSIEITVVTKPLLTIIKELIKRNDIKSVSIEKGGAFLSLTSQEHN